jgi:hypothetical protein
MKPPFESFQYRFRSRAFQGPTKVLAQKEASQLAYDGCYEMKGKTIHTGNGHLSYVKQHSCAVTLDAKGIATNWQRTKTGNKLDISS